MNCKLGSEVAHGNEQESLRDLNGFTPELSRILLAWWELHGRKDPALKPWMFTPEGAWPLPEVLLDPYGIWIA